MPDGRGRNSGQQCGAPVVPAEAAQIVEQPLQLGPVHQMLRAIGKPDLFAFPDIDRAGGLTPCLPDEGLPTSGRSATPAE